MYHADQGLRTLGQIGSGRLWIVVNFGRTNRPAPLLDWLGKNCRLELDITRPRYDAFEYSTLVFLHDARQDAPTE